MSDQRIEGLHHMSLDIKGALTNWSDRRFVGVFKHDDGRSMSPREAKAELLDRLAAGELFIPCGTRCDNFDPKIGCKGHPEPRIENVEFTPYAKYGGPDSIVPPTKPFPK